MHAVSRSHHYEAGLRRRVSAETALGLWRTRWVTALTRSVGQTSSSKVNVIKVACGDDRSARPNLARSALRRRTGRLVTVEK